MKINVCLCFLVLLFAFCCLPLQAQTENDPAYHETNAADCEQLNAVATAVVRYKTTATCYLRIGNTSFFETTQELFIVQGENKYRTVALNKQQEFLLENLPLNADFSVYYYNSCKVKTILTTFTTAAVRDHSQGLLISSPLFDVIAAYYKTEGVSLSDYLRAENALNYYEKLSFWQDIAFQDEGFDANLPQNDYPPAPKQAQAGGDCICLLLLTEPFFAPGSHNNTAAPTDIPVPDGSIAVNNGFIGWDETVNNSGEWVDDDPSHGGYSRSLHGKGAARRQLNDANGRKIHSRESQLNVSGTDISPYYAQIKLNWYCFTDLWHFDNCGCKKDISYTAKYNTRLRTKMELPSCFLCGDKRGLSKAEDWSLLTLHSQAGNVEVLSAGHSIIGSKCKQDWNPDFFINIIDIASGVATALLSGGELSDWAVQVNTIAEEIQTLIQTPVQTAGDCEVIDQQVALIHEDGIITIEPNMPYYLTLFSMGNTSVKGATSWDGYAYISSDFRLGIAIPYGYYNDQPETCCTYGLSSWVMANFERIPVMTSSGVWGTIPDPYRSPTNLEAMMDDIKSFFDIYMLGFNYTEYGAMWKKACISEKWAADIDKVTDLSGEYTLYDISGRPVVRGDIGRLAEIHASLQLSPLPKGMYILHFKSGNQVISQKIVKY